MKIQTENKLKKIFLIASLVFMVSLPLTTYAAGVDIPCRPSDQNGGNDLFSCINQLYKYALVICSIAAVFMIMLAGYMYIFSGGDSKKVGTAKSFISTSLLGLVVLLAGFLLLKQINPNLLVIKSITPQQIGQRDWFTINDQVLQHYTPPGSGGGGGGVPGRQCVPATQGPATVANLTGTCFGANAQKASSIANLESGGIATRHGDKCADGNFASWGLFQINISANKMAGLNCPAAFDVPASGKTLLSGGVYNCHVVNQALYNQCVQAASNEANNIAAACAISRNGTTWRAWSTNSICHF
jgi:hypothetical protein